MSYQVLARKWRPRTFTDMVGQEPILRMLTNALQQKRIHHAYLLTGTRGVGKTTLGRILAKSLNCETGITPTPCGQCHACLAIDKGQFIDLFEVDAASRTKVEDTRELLDNVLYPPTQGRYKIYLIDEVHMLSNHSFNALLKTLEEPPQHVKFILATTDPKKLPITILSRCLQFYLKHITPEQITQHLLYICQQENISADEKAMQLLAKAANGSMRDALSLLDQAIAYGEGHVSEAEIKTMLGCMAQDDIIPLLKALSEQNGSALLTLIKELGERTPDFQQILDEMSTLFHQIAMNQILPEGYTGNPIIHELARAFSPEDIQVFYQICLLGKRDLPIAPTPQQGFEMIALRLLAFKTSEIKATREVAKKENIPLEVKHIEVKAAPVTTSAAVNTPLDWRQLLPKLELTGMTYALAANCNLQSFENNKVTLTIAATHEPMISKPSKERLVKALEKQLGMTIQLDIIVSKEVFNTPSQLNEKEHHQKLINAKTTALADPAIKKLVEMYDASVEVSLA